jgi:hypothetical protein
MESAGTIGMESNLLQGPVRVEISDRGDMNKRGLSGVAGPATLACLGLARATTECVPGADPYSK